MWEGLGARHEQGQVVDFGIGVFLEINAQVGIITNNIYHFSRRLEYRKGPNETTVHMGGGPLFPWRRHSLLPPQRARTAKVSSHRDVVLATLVVVLAVLHLHGNTPLARHRRRAGIQRGVSESRT